MDATGPNITRKYALARPGVAGLLAGLCCFIAGLSLSRLLFEALFPVWGWLGTPLPALAFGVVAAGFGAAGAIMLGRRMGSLVTLAVLPLLINLLWLFDPAVELARGRFLFACGWWLSAIMLAHLAVGDTDRRWRWLGPLFVAGALLPVYLLTMSHVVGAADTFEFQVVAPQLGIAHPTGYPLYMLLGNLFSQLPLGSVAWRLNLASSIYAVLAAVTVFRLVLDLLRRPLTAVLGAVTLGLIPVFWSQAIIAEVYTLHALVVAVALWLMAMLVVDDEHHAMDRMSPSPDTRPPSVLRYPSTDRKRMVGLAFVLGLGLTNHLTTVFLLPPAAIAILLNLWPGLTRRSPDISRRRSLIPLLLQLLIAFSFPLLLYSYLPLRWAAINDEAMGTARFVDWVVGGRFQGALQWGAWLRDPARWPIVGRLVLDAWGWFYLALAAAGWVWLFFRQWRVGVVLLVAAAGFTFYTLNYYVPDLAVFLIPTHLIIAVLVAVGVQAIASGLEAVLGNQRVANPALVGPLLFLLALLPMMAMTGNRWPGIDQSNRDGGEPWARIALEQPLARRAAILADSEKIAPLYYLQQIEGLRPDLDITVLPDEATYRAELDARVSAGQAVYLARYLPGLAGTYHLRSVGPLVEVSLEPLLDVPSDVTPSDLVAGPLRMVGYRLDHTESSGAGAAGLTLYWTLDRPLSEGELPPVLYLRWAGGDTVVTGAHPAGDAYPVNAWRPGEIVADYHLLPLPNAGCGEAMCDVAIEVAVAPRFTPPAEMAWQVVTTVPIFPPSGPVGRASRLFFDGFALDGIEFPAYARPEVPLPLRYSGHGGGDGMTFMLVPENAANSLVIPARNRPAARLDTTGSVVFSVEVNPAEEEGPHVLIAYATGDLEAMCGWLAMPTTGCVVAELDSRGAPLAEGAVNFADKIALIDIEVAAEALAPGGQFPVTITWQGLGEMAEDYTVFVQILDAADRIAGQVDAWPVQGTRPTSLWQPGDTIIDPYVVQLAPDLLPGNYRLHVGFYLLATGQRLPVVDEVGNPVDDKVEMGIGVFGQ